MMNFLSQIAVFLTIGLAADLILFGVEERKALDNYLNNGRNGSWSERFISFISQADRIVFSRFFSERATSRRFIYASLVVSATSFAAAVTIQAALDPQYAAVLKFTRDQVILIALLFIINCLFDYASIIQTKIFLEFAMISASPSKSILLLFCDVIFKMNAFILVFSAVLLSMLYLYTRTPASMIAIFPSGEIGEEESASVVPEALVRFGVASELAADMTLKVIPAIIAAESGGEAALLAFYATPNLQFDKFIKSYLTNLRNVSVEVDYAELDDAKV